MPSEPIAAQETDLSPALLQPFYGRRRLRAANRTRQDVRPPGTRGIRIFASDKEQLRENIVRSGDRALALDLHSPRMDRRRRLRRMAMRGLDRGRALAAAFQRQMAAFRKMRRVRGVPQDATLSI